MFVCVFLHVCAFVDSKRSESIHICVYKHTVSDYVCVCLQVCESACKCVGVFLCKNVTPCMKPFNQKIYDCGHQAVTPSGEGNESVRRAIKHVPNYPLKCKNISLAFPHD